MKRKFTNCIVNGYFIFLTFLPSTFAVSQVTHTVTFNKSDFSITNETASDGKKYTMIKSEKYFLPEQQGNPSLPIHYIKLFIPSGQTIKSIIIGSVSKESITFSNDILPCQPPIPTRVDYILPNFVEPNSSIYTSNNPFPVQIVEISNEGWFDGTNHVVTVAVYPFRYYPVKHKADFFSSITFTINTESSKDQKTSQVATKNRSNDIDNMYHDILVNMVANPQLVPSLSLVKKAVSNQCSTLKNTTSSWSIPFYTYEVITSRALVPAFTQLVMWKKRKGLNAGVVAIEDILADPNATCDPVNSNMIDNAAKLRQYLKSAWESGTVYALLGGDYSVVPIRYGNGCDNYTNSSQQIPSDLYFADFNGDWNYDNDSYIGEPYGDRIDYNPEIYVGRILCTTTSDVLNWAKKELLYEQNPGNGDLSYLMKSFMTQADQMQNENQAATVAGHLLQFTHTIWNEKPLASSPEPTTDATRKAYAEAYSPQFPKGGDVITQINSHYGLVSIFNHGSPQGVATASDSIVKYHANYTYALCSQAGYTSGGAWISEASNGFNNLSNVNYPSIVYSIACETNPFDNYKLVTGVNNMGFNFTGLANGGGPAYLGNTRDGLVYYSYRLYNIFADKLLINPSLGVAEAQSKANFINHFVILSHNLVGDPETPMWTATPSTFNGATVAQGGSSVTVNTGGIVADRICVMSALNTGYFNVQPNVSSYTFTNVTEPYYVTITKSNYIPLTINPTAVYIQNQTISSTAYLNCQSVAAGYSVTALQTYGNVTIQSGANITLDATGDILLDKGFEAQLGANFEAK